MFLGLGFLEFRVFWIFRVLEFAVSRSFRFLESLGLFVL